MELPPLNSPEEGPSGSSEKDCEPSGSYETPWLPSQLSPFDSFVNEYGDGEDSQLGPCKVPPSEEGEGS